MNKAYALIVAALTAALVGLAGCGGGGAGGGTTAGIGGTGKVASGTITGFGSIFVNDGEYEIDASLCDVDDEDRSGTCQANLQIGMVVTVTSDDFNQTTRTGTATSVVYDDDVEGPVTGLIDDGSSKRFSVLGTAVVVDAASTVFDGGFSFDTITNDDIVEVSGFFDAGGALRATYIENKGTLILGTTEVELKGIVSGAGAGAAAGDSFTIGTVTVNILPGADLGDVPGGLVTDGMFVEAKGVLTAATTISASRVEQEDDGIGENEDDASIEGLISNYVSNSSFRVAGQQVNASSAVFEPSTLMLRDGFKVEVEGPIVSGILIAEEVKAEGGDIEIDASVGSTSLVAGTITLTLGVGPGSLTVRTDAKTEFDDDTGVADPMTLADVNPTDFLEIRGYDDGTGNIVATEIRRSADTDNDVILQGPLDDFDTAGNTITVLGVVFSISGATSYEDQDDNPLADAATFDALVSNGDIVKIKDNDPSGPGAPNTVADEVDLES